MKKGKEMTKKMRRKTIDLGSKEPTNNARFVRGVQKKIEVGKKKKLHEKNKHPAFFGTLSKKKKMN